MFVGAGGGNDSLPCKDTNHKKTMLFDTAPVSFYLFAIGFFLVAPAIILTICIRKGVK